MCMCGKPTINGEAGYSWDGKSVGVRPVAPPALDEGDVLIYDEPGRCGGLDAHSHHYRLVKRGEGKRGYVLLVEHGGGRERIELGVIVMRPMVEALGALDSTARYWLLHTFHSLHSDATRDASARANSTWRRAAAEKRIKTRRYPARGMVKVWIEEPLSVQSAALSAR